MWSILWVGLTALWVGLNAGSLLRLSTVGQWLNIVGGAQYRAHYCGWGSMQGLGEAQQQGLIIVGGVFSAVGGAQCRGQYCQ